MPPVVRANGAAPKQQADRMPTAWLERRTQRFQWACSRSPEDGGCKAFQYPAPTKKDK